ncbi:MAG: hypothetical protein ACKVVT_18805 [Dehalococcoidia bacterium]
MRVLCLWFPRLGASLAAKQHPALDGRPLILLTSGPNPAVAGCTTEATVRGIHCGMSAVQARALAPQAAFVADNASACLELLERTAAVIRARATERVELGGREHLFVDVAFSANDEPAAARRLQGLVQAWSGLEVRAGLASSRQTAFEAARAARRHPLICAPDLEDERAIAPFRADALSAGRAFSGSPSGVDVRTALVSLLAKLQTLLSARGESYREATVTLDGPCGSLPVLLRAHRPLHEAAAVVDLLRRRLDPESFDGVTRLSVSLARLGPDVRVRALPGRAVAPPPAAPSADRLLRRAG